MAPLVSGGEYYCGHHVLLAHAAVYHLYQDKYKHYGGRIGITLNSRYFYPKDGVNESLTERGMQYMLGWFAHPIFTSSGGYPPIMVNEIREHCDEEGLPYSRLPFMSPEQKTFIRGSADFLSFNYYTSNLVEHDAAWASLNTSFWDRDVRLIMTSNSTWKQATTEWIHHVPQGLGDCLRFIKKNYGNPEVLITENGWSDDGQLEDDDRTVYLREHLREVLKAKKCDDVNVVGHGTWSLLDNFEWLSGFT